MLKLVTLLFLGMSLSVYGFNTTAVTSCTRNDGELPLNVYIDNCITPPCLLPQNQDAVLNVVFRAPRYIRSMSTYAVAFLAIISYPYGLGEEEKTCNYLENSYCPVVEGEVITYTLRMFIEPFFPAGIPVTLEFMVVDQDEEPVFCFRVPIRVVQGTARDQTLQLEHQY